MAAAQGPRLRTFEFHFVERMHRAANSLRANIERFKQQCVIPDNFKIHIHCLKFEEAYDRHIRSLLQANPTAPAFALVDPFGWTGIPMSILGELTKRPSTEILVNFMFEEINRFLAHPSQGRNFDALFGCSEWDRGSGLVGSARKKFIHDLYRDQLHNIAGAKFVRSFEMRNDKNATDYFLYFASSNRLGLAKMKEAMWKADPGGGFMFSDATNLDQAVLFEPQPDRGQLRRLIAGHFSDRCATVQDVEDFVVEKTPFLSSHYRKILKEMENEDKLTCLQPAPGRRKGTFALKSAVLQFRRS